jgi:hypothetical protein
MNEMNITSVVRILETNDFGAESENFVAVIDGITMSVPLDPANRHYAEILRQVEAGTLTIQEAS